MNIATLKVTGGFDDEEEEEGSWGGEEEESDEDDEGMEYFILQESTGYMAPTLTFLAITHTVISLLCVFGYYYLKVYPVSSSLVILIRIKSVKARCCTTVSMICVLVFSSL